MPWTEHTMTDILVSGYNWIMLSRKTWFVSWHENVQKQVLEWNWSIGTDSKPKVPVLNFSSAMKMDTKLKLHNLAMQFHQLLLENVKYCRQIRQDQGWLLKRSGAICCIAIDAGVKMSERTALLAKYRPGIQWLENLWDGDYSEQVINFVNTPKAKPKTKSKEQQWIVFVTHSKMKKPLMTWKDEKGCKSWDASSI